MPSTVNGIGTHYYGKKEAVSRAGTCQHCGARVNLESYTTRLWFVIVFIPIIPLKRVRLLDYCPKCSRHWVTNPEQYEMSRQLAVSGAMDKYREQPSVEAAMVVHAQFLSFHMHSEADQFREAVLTQYPKSAELHAGLASHLDQTGRWIEATPLYEKALELQPALPEARASIAWRRQNENRLDEAYDLLDFLRKPGAAHSFNLGQLESLAQAYQAAGNHERTLELCAHLLSEFPSAGDQFAFRKMVLKSERALHRSPSLLPEKTMSLRGLFDSKSGTHAPWVRWTVFGGIVAVLFAIGMAGMNEYRRTHRTLHVINAFADPILVSVDGGPEVSVSQRTPLPISEGTHTLRMKGLVTREAEITLHSGYWTRWTYSPAWAFNIERMSPLVATTLFYAANPTPSDGKWLNETELSFVPHVDYLFEEPPQSIQVEGKNRVVTKVHLGTVSMPPTTLFVGLQGSPDSDVAMRFAEGHLNRNPNDASLLTAYLGRAKGEQEERRVTEFLKGGLWKTPISVVWHRAYQNLKSVRSDPTDLVADYDRHLAASPNDAALLYLRGRVGGNRAEQLKFFRQADQNAPQLGWPSMALAYDEANRGEWAQAKIWCDKANTALHTDPSFRGLRHVVRMANGESGSMEAEYRQQLQSKDYGEVLLSLFCLADVQAAQGKQDQVRQTLREWLARMAGRDVSPENMSMFDPLISYLCADVDSIRKQLEQPTPGARPEFLFQGLLAVAEPDAALKLEGRNDSDDGWETHLAVSLSYALAGNPAEADAWRARACTALLAGDHDEKRAAALLSRAEAPTDEELDEIVLRINDTSLLVAALARQFPDRRQELSQRAQRLNISRLHPYLLVKRAVEEP